MICQEILTVLCEDSNDVDLDRILVELCELVIKGQQEDQNHSGMVGACVVGPKGRAYSTSHNDNGKWSHAEREAIEYYESAYGPVDDTCSVVTTLSPCTNKMSDRAGSSCADFLASKGISKVYCGYKDPTQGGEYKVTDNSKIKHICKELADTFLSENFHDGKVKGKSRPGRVKRAGASCAGSVSSLRAKAHKYGGEKGKMYHWCANMKSGKKK